jgi:hypothetical protein
MKTLFILFLILSSATTFAQIEHIPSIFHDLDGDGIEDFVFEYKGSYSSVHHTTFNYATVAPRNGAQIAMFYYRGYQFIDYMEFSDTINSHLIWSDKTSYLSSVYLGYPLRNDKKDYFIGIRIKKNDSYYYGWIRFQGNTVYKELRDAAIQINPDTLILAGEGINSIKPIVYNVSETYDGNNGSGLNVKFFSPFYSNLVEEYRIFVMKNSDPADIEIEDLLALPETNYQKIEAGEREYSIQLNVDLNDITNEKILAGEDYRLIILAISNKLDSFPHGYSLTPTFTFRTFLSAAGTPLVIDTGNDGNSSDLKFSFTKNNSENYTDEYRIMVLPKDSAVLFDIKQASQINEGNYYPLNVSNDSIYNIENISIPDIYGNVIEQNKSYQAFIYSVQDSNYSNIGSLSLASNTFCLATPNYFYVGQTNTSEYKEYPDGLESEVSNFDFDKDGNKDLSIVSYVDPSNTGYKYGYKYKHTVQTFDSTEVIFLNKVEQTLHLASNCVLGEVLDNNNNWGGGEYLLYYSEPSNRNAKGEFKVKAKLEDPAKGNIGFRKIAQGDTIYGWINLRVSWYSFTHIVYQYAWQNRSSLSSPILPKMETAFVAYPNPSSDRNVNIAIKKFVEGEDYYIDILNSSKALITTYKLEKQLSQIKLIKPTPGLYFIRLRTPYQQATQRIMLL